MISIEQNIIMREFNNLIVNMIYQEYGVTNNGLQHDTCKINISSGYYLQVNIRFLVERTDFSNKNKVIDIDYIKPITKEIIEFFTPYYKELKLKKTWTEIQHCTDAKDDYDLIIYKKVYPEFMKLYPRWKVLLQL